MSTTSLTEELRLPGSPVRRFFDEHFGHGVTDIQRRYRQNAPDLTIAGNDANPGTIGTAADWLLRFLVHPSPDLGLAVHGAVLCKKAGINLMPALAAINRALGVPWPPSAAAGQVQSFNGPISGSSVDGLERACWALALLTEVRRGGVRALDNGPLGRLRGHAVSGEDLLAFASPAALDQLAQFRQVFERDLIPKLAARRGRWVLGPTFAGSKLINADADLIAAGLLLDLKTSTKPALSGQDLFQLIGYALLDFNDEYQIAEVGTFNARYAYLATWDLRGLLDKLAGRKADLPSVRGDFRRLLDERMGSGAAPRSASP